VPRHTHSSSPIPEPFARAWIAHFRTNRGEALPAIPDRLQAVPEPLRRTLARSLQRFQVGEQGDGAHLKRAAAALGPGFAAALDLFVAEEQGHARLLAAMLRGLGVRPLRWHWSDAVFTRLRRASGLRTEVLVLLVAEIVGREFYRAAARVPEPSLAAGLGRILRDEEAHVVFHCGFLRRSLADQPGPARWLVRLAWPLFFRAVCEVAILDHDATIRALGCPPAEFRARCLAGADAALAAIFGPARRAALLLADQIAPAS
jgi:hypothetical protein